MIPPEIYQSLKSAYEDRDRAEDNLACIVDALNTIARETNQTECDDYLGHHTLRDALQRIVDGALKKSHEDGYTDGWNDGLLEGSA